MLFTKKIKWAIIYTPHFDNVKPPIEMKKAPKAIAIKAFKIKGWAH
jgi:hypothetical protein